jgi:hypothetical protein
MPLKATAQTLRLGSRAGDDVFGMILTLYVILATFKPCFPYGTITFIDKVLRARHPPFRHDGLSDSGAGNCHQPLPAVAKDG